MSRHVKLNPTAEAAKFLPLQNLELPAAFALFVNRSFFSLHQTRATKLFIYESNSQIIKYFRH